MIRHSPVLSARCAVACLLALAVAVAEGSPISAQAFGFGAPAAVNSNAATDSGSHDNVDLAQGNGVWICVWETDDSLGSTIGSDFDILWSRSTDGGNTWSTLSPLNTNAATDSEADNLPNLATDGAGNWVVVWESNEAPTAPIGNDNDIFISTSSDDGASWSAPALLNSNGLGDSSSDTSPVVATDGAGNWVAVWMSNEDIGGSIGGDIDLLFATSADNGATWSAADVLNSNATTDSVSDNVPQLAADSSGNVVCVWHSTDPLGATIGTDADILFAHSSDSGATWGTTGAVSSNAPADTGIDVTADVATDNAGNFVVAWESYDTFGGTLGTDGDIVFARSTDGGATWGTTAVLGSNAASDTGNDSECAIAADDPGNWLAVWHSNDTLGGTVGTDPDVFVSRSTDGGATWSAVAALAPNAPTSFFFDGEPCVANGGAGNWAVVWSSGDDLGATIGNDFDILVSTSSTVPVELSGFGLE